MTGLAVNRDTKQIDTTIIPSTAYLPVAANTILYAGSLVFSDANGRAVPGSVLSTLIPVGVAQSQVPNRTTDPSGGGAGALSVTVIRGTFPFDMGGGGDAITIANRFSPCYASDDHTVNLTSLGGTRPWAGTIIDVVGTQAIVAVGVVVGNADTDASSATELSSRSFVFNAAQAVAGQGTGADTNGTARVYNIGAVLPAGALLRGYMGRVVTTATGQTTLSATIGSTGAATEIGTALNLMGSAGYTVGTVGAKKDTVPTAAQLLLTVTPDGGAKVSDLATGEFHVTVWFIDGTAI